MKEVIVISDIEMGGGNVSDDFISDKLLAKFILNLKKKKNVDLILNGDTFDFLKCPYVKDGKHSYPFRITEEISLSKVKAAVKGHRKVFDALGKFTKKHNVYFTVGNHDADLVWPRVQQYLKRTIGNINNVHFPGFVYKYKDVWVEHGHLYDFLNKTHEKLFIKYKGELVLDIPWVSQGVIRNFGRLKESNPFLERIHPRNALFKRHKHIARKTYSRMAAFMGKSVLYYPIRYLRDPTTKTPFNLIKDAMKRSKQYNWSLDYTVTGFKEAHDPFNTDYKVYVLGHVHEKHVEENNGVALMHVGSWRDEYDLNEKTLMLTCRPKRYVHIKVSNKGTTYEVKEAKHKRKQIMFQDVIADQFKVLERVAKEEGYVLPFKLEEKRKKKRLLKLRKIRIKRKKKNQKNQRKVQKKESKLKAKLVKKSKKK